MGLAGGLATNGQASGAGAGTGTVTSVTSGDNFIAVASGTTTPVLTEGSALTSALAAKAPVASPTFTTALTAANPTFTGTVTVPAASIANASLATVPNLRDVYMMPSGALAESVPRWSVDLNTAATTTGTLRMVAIVLAKGTSVTNISFVAGNTGLAASAASNQWFAIFDNTRAKLGVTADDTTAAWTASSGSTWVPKTLAVTGGPFVTTYEGIHYLGIVIVGSSALTLMSFTGRAEMTGAAPILGGSSTGSLTNPASCPSTAGAISSVSTLYYAYVS